MTCDESDLAAELSGGSEAAFAVIFDRHARAVFRVCARRLGHQDAEDAMASTFLQAWQLRDRLVLVDGCLRPWLLGIAVNVSRNAARTDRRRAMAWQRQANLWKGDAAGPEHAVVEAMTAAHDAAIIAAGIERLPDRERSVVELCLLEGLSTEAAARALAVPEGTVRSRLCRARARLRALLQTGESGGETSRSGERAAGVGHQKRGRHHVVSAIDTRTGGHR